MSFSQKYGFNVFNLQPEDLFSFASENGLTHIEINLSKDHLTLETFNNERINRINTLSEKHSVTLSFHLPYFINISEVLPHIRKENLYYLTESVNIASKLNLTHITIHVGNFYWFPVEKWMRKKALDRFIKSMNSVINNYQIKGVKLALENVVPIPKGSEFLLLGDNIADFNYIFENVQSDSLMFCLDTGHANMAEGVLKYLEKLSEKLCCIHYHDNNSFNDEHLPIGKGNINWEKISKKLIDIKYNGPIVSECRGIEAHESAALFEEKFEMVKSQIASPLKS